MKRILLSLVAIATLSLSSLAQAPEGFNYQAVVRDAGGLILNSQVVGMQLTIQQGSIGGTAVYTETFSSTTNGYGLVNLEIGTGTSIDDFSTIDWANGPYFMETAVDVTGGTSYSVMGTSQLMSVPYALYAKTSGNGEGPAGPAGADGAPGTDGTNGTNGAVGATGADGAPGTDGTNGTNGAVGATGADGAPGTNGTNGTNGAVGTPGTNGTNGTNGAVGATGADGAPGIDGATTLTPLYVDANGHITINPTPGGEWTDVQPLGDAVGGAMSSDGTKQIVTVRNGNIFYSHDSGITWTENTVGGGSKQWWGCTSSADGTNMVAVVGKTDSWTTGNIWRSVDSGLTWTEIVVGGGPKRWVSITSGGGTGGEKGGDGSILVAVSYGDGIYYSIDSGLSWTLSSTSAANANTWRGIASSSDGTVVYASAYYGKIWKSINSGQDWIEISGGIGDPIVSQGMIACSADGINVYVGTFAQGDEIWISSTSGSSGNWIKPTSISDPYSTAPYRRFNNVACSKGGDIVWISGAYNGIWLSVDSGANFTWELGQQGQGGTTDSWGGQLLGTSSNGCVVLGVGGGSNATGNSAAGIIINQGDQLQ